MSLNRRQIFRAGASLAAAPALLSAKARAKMPRSIIFMVSDGMSAGVIPTADAFSKIVRGGKGTHWTSLLGRRDAVRGFFDMASLNSMVTDSSAASSSWGSGSRIFNAMLNVLPDGTKLTPIAALAREKKKRIGLVTTATVTHATPAGFAAVSKSRDDEDGIAVQYLDTVDVVLGGGRRFFTSRKDKRDLAADFAKAGYQVSMKKADLSAKPGQKLLGLYDASHMPYTLDHQAEEKLRREVPTLAEMTRAALTSLDSARDGFLLQVEGARIDHAAHANDAAAQLWDQLAFDDAIGEVLEYVQKRPDTLVVITSDHGNSNPGLIGIGAEYEHSNEYFARLAKVRRSFTALTAKLGSALQYAGLKDAERATVAADSAKLRAALVDDLGFEMTDTELRALADAMAKKTGLSLNKQLDSLPGIMGQIVGGHTGVQWVGTTHTADYTFSTALGPGAEEFSGLVRNTDVFRKLTAAMGVKFENPSMDAAKAKQYAAAVPARRRSDWA